MLFIAFQANGQEKKEEVPEVKTGWTFGALPAITFDSDLGFQYGALVTIFDFGDGSTYPEYRHSLYLEVSRFTKGTGFNRFYYDSYYLLNEVRVTADVSYLTEQALQFYGFNGYQAVYNPNFENSDHPDYISRLFYSHQRNMFRVMLNFQGHFIKGDRRLRWITGLAMHDIDVGSIDLERLNRGQSASDKLPEVPTLYDKYVEWGVLKGKEVEGNRTTYLKAGIAYDNRDNEPHPFKGMWSEAVVSTAPNFLGNGDYSYSKLTLFHRQYFTVISKKLSAAYRLGYQGTLSGRVPFHMQPHLVTSTMTGTYAEGLGGSRTLRGILRNRVVGEDFILANAELRWKFFKTYLFKQHFYVATNLFYDTGKITRSINLDLSGVLESEKDNFFSDANEVFHHSAGLGLKFAMNENFIVSCDYGRAFDRRDGSSGLYIGLNFLY
ncbi:MAG: hypothetical protein ACFCUU_06020 [Cyclobacteriaceae bacterium]